MEQENKQKTTREKIKGALHSASTFILSLYPLAFFGVAVMLITTFIITFSKVIYEVVTEKTDLTNLLLLCLTILLIVITFAILRLYNAIVGNTTILIQNRKRMDTWVSALERISVSFNRAVKKQTPNERPTKNN
jgi:hypothetical protein